MKQRKNEKKGAPQTALKTETRSLPVKLSMDELRVKGQDLARASQKHEQELASKKTTNAQLKAAIDSAAAQVSLLSNVVASGEEVRTVICEWRLFTPKATKKSLVRQDTGETVEIRDLSMDDTQRQLPGILSAADAEKKKDEDALAKGVKTVADEAAKAKAELVTDPTLGDLPVGKEKKTGADAAIDKLAKRKAMTPDERKAAKNKARKDKRAAAKPKTEGEVDQNPTIAAK